MPDSVAGVPVNLSAVEATIRAVEEETSWSIPLPGRTVIHQLFVSLASDQGGFAIAMSPDDRQAGLYKAESELSGFLREVINKSKKLAPLSGYKGKEVGFPVIVHEMDKWAMRINCNCWPR